MKCDSNLELNFKFTSLWVWEDFVGGLHYQGVSLKHVASKLKTTKMMWYRNLKMLLNFLLDIYSILELF